MFVMDDAKYFVFTFQRQMNLATSSYSHSIQSESFFGVNWFGQ